MRPSLPHRSRTPRIVIQLRVRQGPQFPPLQPSMTLLPRSIHPHRQRWPSRPPLPRLPLGNPWPLLSLSFQWGKMPRPSPGTTWAGSPSPATGNPRRRPQSAGTLPAGSAGRPPPLPGPPTASGPILLWPPPIPALARRGYLGQHRPAAGSIGRHQMHSGYPFPVNPSQGLAVQGQCLPRAWPAVDQPLPQHRLKACPRLERGASTSKSLNTR